MSQMSQYMNQNYPCAKGGLISEGILTLVPLSTKGAKSLFLAENLKNLYTGMARKYQTFCLEE